MKLKGAKPDTKAAAIAPHPEFERRNRVQDFKCDLTFLLVQFVRRNLGMNKRGFG